VAEELTRRFPEREMVLLPHGKQGLGSASSCGFVHDVIPDFKGFNRHVPEALECDAIRSTGRSFQIKVTYPCQQERSHIVEEPVTFEYRRVHEATGIGPIIVPAFPMVW
jgi:hypothetical protein